MALTTILLSSAKRMNDAKLLVQSDPKMKMKKTINLTVTVHRI